MAQENFDKVYARIRVYEGGNVDDPRDPGGRTSRGVTQRSYDAYRARKGLPHADVWKATDAEIMDIYREDYWNRINGDDLPAGIDMCLMDGAVNSGVGQAAKWVQKALGIRVDGDFGPQTISAIKADGDNDLLIENILERRMAMLRSLKTFKTYGKGWSARVANVKKISEAWATGSIGPMPVEVHQLGGNQKALIEDVKQPMVSVSSTQVATAATGVSAGITNFTSQAQPVVDQLDGISWLSWLKYILAGLTLVSIIVGVIATIAQKRADAAKNAEASFVVDASADENLAPVPVNDNTPPPAGDVKAA